MTNEETKRLVDSLEQDLAFTAPEAKELVRAKLARALLAAGDASVAPVKRTARGLGVRLKAWRDGLEKQLGGVTHGIDMPELDELVAQLGKLGGSP